MAAAGHTARVYETPWCGAGAHVREDEKARIGRWLTSLPRPVGVMASNDVRGIDVLNACQTRGLRVPDEVAVLGVDDDALLCEICSPPLSSVVPNIEAIGYEAAARLDRLMDGEREESGERFVPPLGVTTRLSTDVLSVGDQEFATAVRFIRENACHGITVTDVLDHVLISRSTLERNFRLYLGRSPQAEIRAAQLAAPGSCWPRRTIRSTGSPSWWATSMSNTSTSPSSARSARPPACTAVGCERSTGADRKARAVDEAPRPRLQRATCGCSDASFGRRSRQGSHSPA